MKYDLFNPSSARRLIHDNLPSARRYEIPPKGTVKNVGLADHVVTHLRAAFQRDPMGELHITESNIVEEAEAAPSPESRIPVQAMQMQIDEEKVTIIKAVPPAKAKAHA